MPSASFPATDEVDDLNAIAIFERSRGPVYAAYHVVIEFDRDPFRGKIEGFDEFVER